MDTRSQRPIELGLDTFGDVAGRADGSEMTPAETLRAIVDEAVLAEHAGLDFFEHHRADYAVSAPDMALAAIGARTERIRVTSAVTVLSSDDPVRVYERFATLQGLTGGRAEVTVGRGAYTESFPLFGLPLERYEELFEDRLDLFVKLLSGKPVTWQGTTRPPLTEQVVHPALDQPLPTWVAVGAAPTRSCAPPGMGCRSCSRSSVARLHDSRHTQTCTANHSPIPDSGRSP